MIPFTPDERRAQFAPSQNPGGPVDPDVLAVLGQPAQEPAVAQPTMNQQVDPDVLDIVNRDQIPLMSSLMSASRVNPDQAAEASRLGARIGVGQDVALRNLDEVRQRAFMADMQARDIARTNPVLASFLMDRNFSQQASDDVGVLDGLKNVFMDVGRVAAGMPAVYVPGELARGYMRGERIAERGRIGLAAQFGEAEQSDYERARQLQEEMRALGEPGFLSSAAEMVAQNVAGLREVAATTLIGGAAGSVIPGLGTAAGMGIGFATGTAATTARMEAGNLYLDLIEQGVSEESAVPAALAGGLINGAIEAVGAKIATAPFKNLLSKVVRERLAEAVTKPTMRAALTQAGKSYVLQVGTEAAEEGTQELTNIVSEEMAKWSDGIKTETTLRQAVDRIIDATAQGAMGAAIIGGIGPGANLAVDLKRAQRAGRQTKFFESLTQNATESKVRGRDAGAYERFVAAQAAGTNAETVFVDGATMRGVLEQAAVTDSQLDAVVPGLAQKVRDAATTGSDVTIPTAQYAARLAGTDLGNALLPHMRLAPDAISATEAQAVEASRAEIVAQAEKLMEEKQTVDAAFVQSAQAVEDSIFNAVKAVGYSDVQARTYAKIHQAMVVVDAAAMGITPEEYNRTYPPTIVGEGMQVPELERADQFDQAGKRRTDTPAFKAWSRDATVVAGTSADFKTGTAFVSEAYHGTSVGDIATFDPLAPSKFRKELERGMGAVWFGAEPDTAANFAGITPEQATTYFAGSVYPVYVTMQNPLVVDAAKETQPDLYVRLPGGQMVYDIMYIKQAAISRAKREGYDGVVFVNAYDGAPVGGKATIYAVFNPSDIKSKFNRGAFSRATANIMEQAARIDTDYMAAVERGDMATAQRMVDEAARASTRQGPIVDGVEFTDAVRQEPRFPTSIEWITAKKVASLLGDTGRLTIYDQASTGSLYGYITFSDGNVHSVRIADHPKPRPSAKTIVDRARKKAVKPKAQDAVTRDEAGNVVPLSRRFDITSPRIFEQAAIPFAQAPVSPGFYSALAKAVDAVDVKSMAASGWKERIKGLVNKGEVKQDEVDWSGLTDWLDMQEGKVTKEAVAEFLKNNGVRVERVFLSDRAVDTAPYTVEESVDTEGNEIWIVYDPDASREMGVFDNQIDAEREADRLTDAATIAKGRPSGETKFGQYTLPGGTNYREMLITIPEIQRVITETAETLLKQGFRVEQTYDELYDATDAIIYDNKGNRVSTTTRLRGKYSDEDLLRDFVQSRQVRQQRQARRDSYASPHWDQPNVLVHFRLNDRVDADGKRVLFVEEIQSDWGQAGRKKGFKGRMTVAQIQEAADPDRRRFYSGMGDMSQDEWSALSERVRQWDEQENAAKSAVPLAPFVETTDGWLNLAIKNILLEATQGNYDRVAFVNGKQSADRYDLSKQVREISWTGYDSRGATKLVTITPLQGNLIEIPIDDRGIAISTGSQFDGKPLDEIVPKEIADQIMAERSGDIRGDGLKVGGKGMIEFYDKIVPAAVNKLLKKYGGGKLATTEIRSPQAAKQMKMSGIIRFESSNDVDDFLTDMSAAGYEDLDYGRSDENELEVYFSDFNQNQFNDASSMYGGYNGRAIELNRTEVPVSATSYEQLGFDVTSDMRETVSGGLPLFQAMPSPGPARGGFDPRRLTTIINKGADVTTLFHELIHYKVEVYLRIASAPDAPARIKADLDELFKFMGIAGATFEERLATYNGLTFEQRRPLEEQITYNFEDYLLEGKAPSLELRGVFDRIAAWMRRVYKSLRDDLNAIYKREFGTDLPILTPEIRAVFDRMLASEEQIKRAEAVNNMKGLFQTQAESGMDDATWAAYQVMQQEATDEAIAALTADTMKQVEWMSNARSKKLKELQKAHDTQRKEVRDQVMAEVRQEPIYRAMEYLKRGTLIGPDGSEATVEGVHKINTALAREFVPGLDMAKMGRGKYGYLAEDGLHPDIVAEMFGFPAGSALLQALADAKPMREVVDARTDEIMVRDYSEMGDPKAQEAAVNRAIHNEARARLVAVEARWLSKATQPVRVIQEAARQAAVDAVGNTIIRNLRPDQYAAAEARASRDAIEAARGADTKRLRDRYGADATREQVMLQAKRQQLYQNALATEAQKADDAIQKGLKYLRRVLRDSNRQRMGADYADQIAGILDRFELAPISRAEAARRADLAAWVEAKRAEGLEPDIDPEVLAESNRRPWRNLTVTEFNAVMDAVKQIEFMGKNERKIKLAAEKADFEKVRDEIVTSVIANAGDRKANARTSTTNIGRAITTLKGFIGAHLKAASIARILDGAQDGGPVWNYLIRSANDAGDKETTMRAQATERLTAMFAPIFKLGKMGGKGQYFPTVDRSFNREARLVIALNMGNDGNIQRLLDGEGWSIEQITPILQSLTEEEWNLVQQVWDYFETYRPEIAAKERELYGKEPNWVEPKPLIVQTADGKTVTLRGGYYPIKYDPRASMRAETMSDAEAAKRDLAGAFTSATTRRSYTKSRVKEVKGRPLLYTLAGMYGGVNEVIHDLSWHRWLIQANRLMRSQAFDEAVRERYGPEFIGQLKTWIKDVAAGERGVQNEAEMALNFLRQGISSAGLGFNVVSAALQITGFNQSIVRVGVKWIGRGIAAVAQSPLLSMKMVNEKSDFMANRSRTQFRELNELRNMVQGDSVAMRRIKMGTYFLMMRMQRMVDVPTWIGAYEKALYEGRDEDTSIALADQAVIDSQGGGMLKDLSRVERGGAGLKLFTVFYGYMNTVYNMAAVQTMTAKNKGKLAADYAMLFVVPVVLGQLIRKAMVPKTEEEPEDLEAIARKLAAEQLSYLMGTMVIVREFGEISKIVAGAEGPRMGYGGPAGLRAVGETYNFATQASQGEFDKAFRKSAVNLIGAFTGLPSAQINRTLDGLDALYEGETENVLAPVTGVRR